MVKPATVLAWHRKGFRLFWRWKSRRRGPGRPRISDEVRRLIIEMAEMNVGWGAPRIHGEMLKLGIEISEITVSRCMPKRPPPAGSRQRWATFMHNHLHETLAIDFAVVPSATFGILYVFFVLSLKRWRVLHFNVTQHPTAEWTARQVVEACPFDLPGRFLIRDNDKIYGTEFRNRVEGLGLEQIRTAFRSPWQNGFAERWIASLRRDCLDHVISITWARHSLRVLRPEPQEAASSSLQRDSTSDRRVDGPAGSRSLPVRSSWALLDSRQRQDLWDGVS